ncbi:MAG: ABC transporter substrate-binding protein [Ottowia sp.]|nr:ABC transporter substrate-binding protein [Ottowia sp.]
MTLTSQTFRLPSIALLLIALLFPYYAHTAVIEKPNIVIAVGGKSALYYLPLTIAYTRGFFSDEGLNVQLIDFPGGSKSLQAVIGGNADVVAGAYEHTIHLQAKHQRFRAFVALGRAPQIVIAIAKSKLARYKSPADFRGLRVGVTAPGASTHMALNIFLTQNGLKPSDVSVVSVGTKAAAVTALRTQQIDAIVNTDPIVTLLEQHDEIHIISDTRTLRDTQILYGGPLPAGSLYAPEHFILAHPKTVQALTNAIVRALIWLRTATPNDIIETVPKEYLLGDPSLYLTAYARTREAFSFDGLINPAATKNMLRVLTTAQLQLNLTKTNLDQTYTNSFVQQALKTLPSDARIDPTKQIIQK